MRAEAGTHLRQRAFVMIIRAYIAESLARRCADDELVDMLAEMKAEHGHPSDADYTRAEQALLT